MEYTIESRYEADILLVTMAGHADESNARDVAVSFGELVARERPSRLLLDVRQLEGRACFGQTYFMTRELPGLPVETTRMAVVEREENREYAGFVETTAANVGRHFHHFFDYDKALAWLRE